MQGGAGNTSADIVVNVNGNQVTQVATAIATAAVILSATVLVPAGETYEFVESLGVGASASVTTTTEYQL